MNLKGLLNVPSLSQMKPRERLLAAGTGFVLLVVLMDRAVLNPWQQQGKAVKEEIWAMEQSLQHHSRLLARKASVLAQLDAYQQYLRPVLANELQVAALLKEIEQLARQSRVTLGEVKPLTLESNPLVTRYPVDVQFVCTLEEWVNFVVRLESSPSLYQIERAAVSVSDEEPDKLKGTLRIVSIAMRPKEADAVSEPGESDATSTVQ